MNNKTQKVIKIAAWTSGIILLIIAGLYLGRNQILRNQVDKRIKQAEQTHGLSIGYSDLQLKGLNEVALRGLSVVPTQRDTILTLQSMEVRLSLWQLLQGNIEVGNVRLDGLEVAFNKQDSIANYDFLFLKKESDNSAEPQKADYAQRVNKLLNLLYGFLPENGELSHLHITERKDSNFLSVSIPAFIIKNNRFHSQIDVLEDTLIQHWQTSGELSREVHTLKADLYAKDRNKISLPYITRRFGAKVTFDTLSYSLMREKDGSSLQLTGKAKVSGLDVYHKALSPEVVHLDKGQLDYRVNIAEQALELDSATTVQFNRLTFHPFLRADKAKGQWHITVAVNKPWFPADELFSSLPQGLFGNLDGIKTSGELAYHLLFDVDLAQPDSLKLESELKEKNFRIVNYGATNLSKMSGEFLYTAYENGQPVRTFPIGPSWEHFTPLDSISPLLRMAVLQSEDGAFFYHRGFLPDAMREALIHDLKVKRFARGGSTISMQLIKNVFLNRNKNFARKLEEAILVWLIETERLTSKERMYEVYLNIAEWGPLVYGIQEASTFYFNKRPSQLTAEESIFLASIIPKPKRFRNSFTEDMKLKENMGGYYRLITERLVKKGLINEAAADSILPDIQVTGEARKKWSGEEPKEEE